MVLHGTPPAFTVLSLNNETDFFSLRPGPMKDNPLGRRWSANRRRLPANRLRVNCQPLAVIMARFLLLEHRRRVRVHVSSVFQ